MLRRLKSRLDNWFCLSAAILAVACSPTHAAPATSTVLTPDKTVVVVASNADKNEKDAANLLQTWLRKANASTSGFDIKNDSDAAGLKDKTVLAIGQTALTQPDARLASLNDDGFIIHSEGTIISIAGHTSNATFYGAVAFLDRYAGVRFYLPGDLWTSLPMNHYTIYDRDDIVSQPFVTSGFITGIDIHSAEEKEWLRRVAGSRRKGGTHQHDLWQIFPPDKFATTHPEIYPTYNGQRYIPQNASDQNWQIDFTAPATLTAAEESITAYFAANPGAAYIAVSVNDSNRWSESDANQKVVANFQTKDPQGNYKWDASSDIYWRYLNQLAAWMKEKYPQKYLVGLAYLPTSEPPAFKLPDNIVVFLVCHVGELSAYTQSANGQPSTLDRWLAMTQHLGIHDWYEGDNYLLPRIYSDNWSQLFRLLSAQEKFAYLNAEAYPNWGLDGPKYYLLARLAWDPQIDPHTLTRQFCADMFGPAAGEMENYFNTLEKLWDQLDHLEGPTRKLGAWSVQFKTTPASRAILQQCHDLLQQAAAKAQTSDEKARVNFFTRGFALSESLFALDANPSDESLHAKALEQANDATKDPQILYKPVEALQAIQAIYKPVAGK